jgi:tryptophanyl-tRNA synthetase
METKPGKILLDPWGAVLVEDYVKVMEEFGLEPLTNGMLADLPNPNKIMRRKVVFCHRDLSTIANAIKRGKPFYALTGIVPSFEKIHFGNKLVVENLAYFQQQGAKTFLLIADLEAVCMRGVRLEDGKKWALDFHIPAYIALGVDPKRTIFYFQSENRVITNLACALSHRITSSEFRAIYGSTDPDKIVAALLDVGDVLHPQLEEKMPGVIPVGIDQDPHIRLARDVAKRAREFNFIPPSAVYHKFTPSLNGSIKMSKSKPGTYIEIPEDPKTVERRLWNAFTGGRASEEEQRKLGGDPTRCVIFEIDKQHLVEDDAELDKIYQDCISGKLLCGDHKSRTIDLMNKFMAEFEERMEKARDLIPELTFVR